MKRLFLALAVTSVIVYATAQTATQSWSGVETQQLLASCQLHNSDSVVCVATDGVAFSYQGAAFVKVASQGAMGPAGPAGATGATGATGPQGPQGIPGPVQSFGTLSCPKTSSGTGLVFGPGCTETTP